MFLRYYQMSVVLALTAVDVIIFYWVIYSKYQREPKRGPCIDNLESKVWTDICWNNLWMQAGIVLVTAFQYSLDCMKKKGKCGTGYKVSTAVPLYRVVEFDGLCRQPPRSADSGIDIGSRHPCQTWSCLLFRKKDWEEIKWLSLCLRGRQVRRTRCRYPPRAPDAVKEHATCRPRAIDSMVLWIQAKFYWLGVYCRGRLRQLTRYWHLPTTLNSVPADVSWWTFCPLMLAISQT